jgi:hypothetical protein
MKFSLNTVAEFPVSQHYVFMIILVTFFFQQKKKKKLTLMPELLQASAAKQMRTALFWITTQRIVVITITHCIITRRTRFSFYITSIDSF